MGGIVRDLISETRFDDDPYKNYLDIDIATFGNGFEIARETAKQLKGTFVPLDEHNSIGRVVLFNNRLILDISQIRGNSIIEDLRQRDFTVNAMAIDPVSKLLHDPFGGKQDIQANKLKAVSSDIFNNDPARLIRAYRFLATKNLKPDQTLHRLISKHHQLISNVARERVWQEISQIIETNCCYSFKQMIKSRLLFDIFPPLTAVQNLEQNDYHHLNVLNHTLESIHQFERLIKNLHLRFQKTEQPLKEYLDSFLPGCHSSRKAVIKLALLLHDVGKSQTRTVSNINGKPRIRFIGHEKKSANIAEQVLNDLRAPGKITAQVVKLVSGHMKLSAFGKIKAGPGHFARLESKSQQETPGLILLVYSDLAATRGSAQDPGQRRIFFKNIHRALNFYFQTPPAPPLLNGFEIMQHLQLKPSPLIGKLKARMLQAQRAGDFCSREEAFIYLEKIFQNL